MSIEHSYPYLLPIRRGCSRSSSKRAGFLALVHRSLTSSQIRHIQKNNLLFS